MTSSVKYYGIEIFPNEPEEETFAPTPVEFAVPERFLRLTDSDAHAARREADRQQRISVSSDAALILKQVADDARGRANAARAREGKNRG